MPDRTSFDLSRLLAALRKSWPLILVITLVAAFVQHAADPFGKKELPLLFLWPALTLIATGAGRFSLDHLIGSIRKAGKP